MANNYYNRNNNNNNPINNNFNTLLNNPIEQIVIIQHNVYTWVNKKDELNNYYRSIDPDIILLNDIGVINTKIKIYNYNVVECNKLNERSAGIAVAVRSNITYKILDNFHDDILGIKLETTKGPIIVLTCYCPPRRNYVPMGEMENILQKNIPVYIIGDLNANMRMAGYARNNLNGNVLKRLIERNKIKYLGPDFRTLVDRPARPDMVIANQNAFLNYAIEQGTLTASDHLPLIVKLSTKPIVKPGVMRRKYISANWDGFKRRIEEKIEGELLDNDLTNDQGVNAEKIEESYIRWTKIITDAEDEYIPKTKIKYYIHARESDRLKLLVEQHKNIIKRPYWTIPQYNLIKTIQRNITEENKKLYQEAWDSKIQNLNDIHKDSAKFWGSVRRYLGSSRETAAYIEDPNNNNKRAYKPEEKEPIYREIWKNIFDITPEENRNFDAENEERVLEYLRNNEENTSPYQTADLSRLDNQNYLLRPFTAGDIMATIKSFKNKAPGISGIGKTTLVNLPLNALTRYASISNLTFSMGYYPVVYKNGLLVFVLKEGKNPKDPISYRPITLLEVPGKLLEKLINNRFARYCEENNIFNKNQYGFRRGLGTDVAIATTYEKIALNQQQKNFCNVVCHDISKAFDGVWVAGLKFKIQQTDLPLLFQKILCSFTTNRTAQIKIENLIGPKFELRAGVPQGGILSPTLFIFYTRDLPPPHYDDCADVIFADDVTQVIEHQGANKRALAFKTGREIERVNRYERTWKIKTNINKFKNLSISKSAPAPVNADRQQVAFSNEINILGLKIKRTGCRSHITQKIGRAKTELTKLKRFAGIKPELMLRLFMTLIRPIMEYPIVPVALAAKTTQLRMQQVQNRALKMAVKGTPDRYLTAKEIHEKY